MWIDCHYCEASIPEQHLQLHHKKCPKNPDNRFIVLAIEAGNPDVITSSRGVTYPDYKDLEKYENSRITGFSYNVYKNQQLLSEFATQIFDSNRLKILTDLGETIKGCHICITYNSIRDSNIINSELFRNGIDLDTWMFSIRDCATNMGFLNYSNRDSIESLWRALFDENLPTQLSNVDIWWKCMIKMHTKP